MVMEHADALERIEIAAAEPDGLDRLMAGDTAEAAAVAGHLAGCAACVAELARTRRTAALVRDVIATEPDPSLRARTLAYVAATGVDRGQGAVADGPPTVPVAVVPRFRPRYGWLLAAAAVAVIAIGIGFVAGTQSGAADGVAMDRQIRILEDTATTALRIQAEPDAQRVALAPTPAGGDASGSLAFSATSGDLVAVATGLAPLGQGQEYGCWIEAAGTRTRIGRMYLAGEVWSWAGPVTDLGEVPPDAVFGVSVGPSGGGSDAIPVLTGQR